MPTLFDQGHELVEIHPKDTCICFVGLAECCKVGGLLPSGSAKV